MRLRFLLLGLLTSLALCWASAEVSHSEKKSKQEVGEIFVEPSSTSVPGGKASLTIGVLTRQADTYIGDYQFKVSPYFFKNEQGKLSIGVSEECLRKLAGGVVVDFTGQATTTGSGKTRRINGTATPLDQSRGSVSLRFTTGKGEMQFNTSYRFNAQAQEGQK